MPLIEKESPDYSDRLAQPLTLSERAESRKLISSLHPANRFRLMFGQTPLPTKQNNVKPE